MIIFGLRGMAKVLGMVSLVCGRCSNPAAHRVVSYRRWFTLFFVPVFPVSARRTTTCTFCGTTTRVTKDQVGLLLAARPAGPAVTPGAQPHASAPLHPQALARPEHAHLG